MTLRGLFMAGGLALFCLANSLPLHAEEDTPDENSEEQAETATPSVYVEMDPPFITNIGQSTGRLSYVKAEVTLRVDSTAETAVTAHEPRLRHEMVMLLAREDREALSSTQGQEALRQQALDTFNQVLEDEQTGATIKDVLFTSFVVQR
ncbi:flagellar basal body-associated FliL family protein [Marinobacter sp. JSM 1782161]|uniref:flagellar basal body-associated FliL family protein n=1 Tax=Marinobacter sp. JSM 1782161 TaxID=2685906 RepID=UPI0014036E24|nr:flagellar basal body-associated FliL family protein [Marinobacter sp. JSM 1782161]